MTPCTAKMGTTLWTCGAGIDELYGDGGNPTHCSEALETITSMQVPVTMSWMEASAKMCWSAGWAMTSIMSEAFRMKCLSTSARALILSIQAPVSHLTIFSKICF